MGADMKFKIDIVDSDESFLCDQQQNVLEGMMRLGRRGIPCGCRGGGCGVCKVEVLDGDYHSLRMSSCHVDADDLAAGRVLACRINPDSDLVIRVVGKMQKCFKKEQES